MPSVDFSTVPAPETFSVPLEVESSTEAWPTTTELPEVKKSPINAVTSAPSSIVAVELPYTPTAK